LEKTGGNKLVITFLSRVIKAELNTIIMYCKEN
jgi:hypothetical protein